MLLPRGWGCAGKLGVCVGKRLAKGESVKTINSQTRAKAVKGGRKGQEGGGDCMTRCECNSGGKVRGKEGIGRKRSGEGGEIKGKRGGVR